MSVFFIKEYVDSQFTNGKLTLDTETIVINFMKELSMLNDNDFIFLLLTNTFIPDYYPPDSSHETLFTKLVEVLVAEWGRRLGFKTEILKEKSSKEDVKIEICNKVIVTDAKTYRLGRSQQAPNVKDFLKLEDVRKWMSHYHNAIGGLITYPSRHEWKESSDAYLYCSNKAAPTVMLSYTQLSYLLRYKHQYDTSKILELWDYNSIFPEALPKRMKGGNKKAYWEKINSQIIKITNSSPKQYEDVLLNFEKQIDKTIDIVLKSLTDNIEKVTRKIILKVKDTPDEVIRESYQEYVINKETEEMQRIRKNVIAFRMS